MRKLYRFLENLKRDERAQDMVEYALLAGFIAVAAGALLPGIADGISVIFSKMGRPRQQRCSAIGEQSALSSSGSRRSGRLAVPKPGEFHSVGMLISPLGRASCRLARFEGEVRAWKADFRANGWTDEEVPLRGAPVVCAMESRVLPILASQLIFSLQCTGSREEVYP